MSEIPQQQISEFVYQDFINLIQDQQLQNSLKLSNTKSIKLGNKTFTKKPLTSKQFAEIAKLNSQLKYEKSEESQIDILVNLRTKAAEYFFGIPADLFDTNFEKLNPIMEGCILRSTSGLSQDIDLDKLLLEYQNKQSKQ